MHPRVVTELRDAVIVATARTPMGRYGGQLKDVRPDDLAAVVIKEAVQRASVRPEEVADVVFGCANQAGEDNRNVARMGLLLAGFPVEVPGQTVNRLCGSGMQAAITAAREIQTGGTEVMVAGGVESMTRAPWVIAKPDAAFPRGPQTAFDTSLGWRLVNPRMAEAYGTLQMGETAERVAAKYEVVREVQDEFALRSHQLAVAAQLAGRFDEEIVPVSVPQRKGDPIMLSDDEGPRSDSSLESLAKLRSAFQKDGTVTAGNASSLNDGAAALVLMSATRAEERGLKPLARFVAAASAGVHPDFMGIGPVPATYKALAAAGLDVEDIGLVELNEAFAAQAVACIRLLGFDEEKVNVNGGAIALGHPLGCSGARLVGTLVQEMNRRQAEFGLATMCIGVGQGICSIWQLVGDSSSSAVRSSSAATSLQRRLAEATTSPSSTAGAAIPTSSRR
ncbi:MAG TPA: thiolase family protein [Candidatus Dormibacteraeota bacterium]|nr:thiolase family protein [Candidatus Dormibacteraeota bacterium]